MTKQVRPRSYWLLQDDTARAYSRLAYLVERAVDLAEDIRGQKMRPPDLAEQSEIARAVQSLKVVVGQLANK